MENKIIPTKIKIDDKWYRAKEEADGSLNFKNDLDYYGSNTKIEYTAIKPNPVLHPGLFHVYNMNGSKVGEFWTDPQISYSGCVSDIEIDKSYSSSSNNINSNENSSNFPRNEETYSNTNSYGEQKTYYDDPFAEAKRNAENIVGQLYAGTSAEERVKSWMEFRKRDEEEKWKKTMAENERRREFIKAEEIVRKRIEAENAEKERQSQIWKEQGLCPDCGGKRFLFFKYCATCITKKIVKWWKIKADNVGKTVAVISIISYAVLFIMGSFACPKVTSLQGGIVFMTLLFLIPFAIIFFAEGTIKRIVFLVGAIILCLCFLPNPQIFCCHDVEVPFAIAAIICNGAACSLAMRFPKWV